MNLILLILGSVCAGASMKLYLFPFNIPSGGAAGLTVMANHFLHVPLGATLFVINALLLGLAYRMYGIGFVIRTLCTITMMSWTVDHLPWTCPFQTEWLSAGVGAICFGSSMSLILASGSTSGGMDIFAKWIERKWGTPFGSNLFCINTTILLTAGALIGWHVALFGVCAQFISNSIINFSKKIPGLVEHLLHRPNLHIQ